MDTKTKVRIVIIDSGIASESEVANKINNTYVLKQNNGSWEIVESETDDFVGHGTAVASIIYAMNNDIEIISIRICNQELEVDESGLIYVLNYVYDNIEANIINISAGIVYLNDYDALNSICQRLYQKGMIMVSAFDNDRSISFPAALDCVVGVDIDRTLRDKEEIIYIKNDIVDIILSEKYYRVEWLGKKTLIKGTSFACAYITGILSLKLSECQKNVHKEKMLSKISTKIVETPVCKEVCGPSFEIKKAILFPVNKESHALLKFKERLQFQVEGVFDDRLSGKVGTILYEEKIRAFESIDWNEDFDTIILSCISDLETLTRKQYRNEIIEKARKYGKNIYSFEKINSDYDNIYYPKLDKNNIPIKNCLKLHKSLIPVVGVFGTSSKQGKFTLQQKLIQMLTNAGYSVGSIATEPSGYLLNADYVFHFGYKSDIQIEPWECIAILNEMVWKIQQRKKDILITGCQSGTIHYDNSHIQDFSIYQYAFYLGVLPDLIVLCINPHDDFEYVNRTIDFLNAIDSGKVCAIAIFPMRAVSTLSGIGYKLETLSDEEMKLLLKKVTKEFGVPAFSMNSEDDMQELCLLIIQNFIEE